MTAEPAGPPPSGAILSCIVCWIELELRDEDDNPVPNEIYWIKLPNGILREGRLDANGFVRLDQIPCGICSVRFPKFDKPDVQWLAAQSGPARDWLEIVLLDSADRPVPNSPFIVEQPGGAVHKGTLDQNGKARLEGIPRGSCKVSFPDFDKADFTES
jgi:hypothetical protein